MLHDSHCEIAQDILTRYIQGSTSSEQISKLVNTGHFVINWLLIPSSFEGYAGRF